MCGFTKLYNSNQDYSSQMRKRFHPPSTALYNLQYSDTFWERIFNFWVFCFHPCLFWQGQGMSPGLLGLGLDHNRLLFSGVGLFPGPSWSILPKILLLVHPGSSYQKLFFNTWTWPQRTLSFLIQLPFEIWSYGLMSTAGVFQLLHDSNEKKLEILLQLTIGWGI